MRSCRFWKRVVHRVWTSVMWPKLRSNGDHRNEVWSFGRSWVYGYRTVARERRRSLVDKRLQQRPWRLLPLCHPRGYPRLRQRLNYHPSEDGGPSGMAGMGSLWNLKMHSRRTWTRLCANYELSLQDLSQDCLCETWVVDSNDGMKENIRRRYSPPAVYDSLASQSFSFPNVLLCLEKNFKQIVTSIIAQ
jgi:hypothetical protein